MEESRSTTGANSNNKGKGLGGRGNQNSGRRRVVRSVATAAARATSKERGDVPDAKSETEDKEGEQDDGDICFICAEPVEFYAIGECNHRTCFLCNLRLRALFKSQGCPYCKTDLECVVYTKDSVSLYEDLVAKTLPFYDKSLGFKCDSKDAYDRAMYVLQFNCPFGKCAYVDNDGWKGLKTHVQSVHSLQFCNLCVKDKMSFCHEHKLFKKQQLTAHYSRGDGVGFTGHPQCKFCNTSFYDNDQLFDHCRKKHEQCFICVRNGSGRYVYYANYGTLEEHFNNDHFSCMHASCQEKKFVVFEHKLDLQGHELDVHGNSLLGQKARRDAKHVNVNFQYSSVRGEGSGSSNRSNAKGKKKEKGNRKPDTMTVNSPDASGVSIAGRRRPAAFGHVSANTNIPHQLHNVLNVAGLAVTESPTSSAEPSEMEPISIWPTLGVDPANGSSTPTRADGDGTMRNRAPEHFGRLTDLTSAADGGTLTKHQELLQRVSAYLSHREQPVSRFREITTQYKNGIFSAEEYIDNCWLLFLTVPGKNAKEMIQRTVKAVAELVPGADQKSQLQNALTNHRIKQQQFPALTPLTGSNKAQNRDSGGSSRTMVIKQTTGGSTNRSTKSTTGRRSGNNSNTNSRPSTPSSVNKLSQNPTWSNSTATSLLDTTAFPSLGFDGSNSVPQIAGSSSARTHNSYSAKFSSTTSAGNNGGGGPRQAFAGRASNNSASEFPDLPTAAIPKRKVIPIDPGATSAWDDASSSLPSTGSSNRNENYTSLGSRQQRKGKGKGKQVLFHVG